MSQLEEKLEVWAIVCGYENLLQLVTNTQTVSQYANRIIKQLTEKELPRIETKIEEIQIELKNEKNEKIISIISERLETHKSDLIKTRRTIRALKGYLKKHSEDSVKP